MKRILLSLVIIIAFASCDTLQNASNSTGSVFTLNGQWKLNSNLPENTIVGTIVTVTPFVAEGKITLLANNSQCYRENDVKWKDIVTDKAGGFNLNNLLMTCTGGVMNYVPATIKVVNNDEIRLVGKNVAGAENTQVWMRVK
ncbi:MAG: hypothetical protein EOO10_23615 [Chitinophagaceae bacterium]|nr:MAG: hypothetical protein EOO10_23615 [Chitinophagaceae bacterium]